MKSRIDPRLIPPAPDLALEMSIWAAGISSIAGIDEAGRGALAGPVVAAALILPPDPPRLRELQGMMDSKQLTPGQRMDWLEKIRRIATAWGVGFASHAEIDQQGIIAATRLAAQRSLEKCGKEAEHLLLDYLFLPDNQIPQTNLIKGDERSLSIAGASILAKITRDEKLVALDADFPGYQFARHKGYATSQHLAALDEKGPSPVHRCSFAPVRERFQS